MSEPLTPGEREAIRARVEWLLSRSPVGSTSKTRQWTAIKEIPRLLDDLERCQEERDRMRAALERMSERAINERALADRLAKNLLTAYNATPGDTPWLSEVRAALASYDERRRG